MQPHFDLNLTVPFPDADDIARAARVLRDRAEGDAELPIREFCSLADPEREWLIERCLKASGRPTGECDEGGDEQGRTHTGSLLKLARRLTARA